MRYFFSFFILTLSLNSFAWGPKGQEITVIIAEQLINPKTKLELLKLTNNKELHTFATWADQARNSSEWNQTGPWHYVNVEADGSYEHESGGEPRDILGAIKFSVEGLRSKKSVSEKLVFLKFLVHFIGDIHQPMHVGNPQDRGGNSVSVSYGKQYNLHALWDSAFIEKKALSNAEYAKKLFQEKRDSSELNKTFSADQVVKENFEMREFLYSFKNGKIDGAYEKKAMSVVDDRMWVGGVRLASLLNEIYK
jgi:hypothetical protein